MARARKASPHAAEAADSVVAFALANVVPALRGHGVQNLLELGWGTDALRAGLSGRNGEGFAVHELEADGEDEALATPLKSGALSDGRLWQAGGWGRDWDAVVSVNLLQRVPPEHQGAVLANLRRHTRRLCFLAIGLTDDPDSIAAPDQPPPVTLRPPQWWLGELQRAGFRELDHRIQRDRAGERDLWLYVYLAPEPPAQAAAAPAAEMTPGQRLQSAMQAHRSGQADQAEALYRQILEAEPKNADALHGLGMLACDAERLEEGEKLIRQAIAIDSKKPSYHSNLGHLLKLKRDFEGALASHEKAIKLAPDSAAALNNMGDSLRDAGKVEDAHKALTRAVELEPGLVVAQWNLCQVELTRGNMSRGWDLFRWGFESRSRKWYGLPLPEYDGGTLRRGTVVLWGDWGIGDQVMFTRLIPRLLERVKGCVCICDERLVPLLSRSFAGVVFHPPIDPMAVRQHFPEASHHLPICDLARTLCPDPTLLGSGAAYLQADKDKSAALRKKYGGRPDTRLVGIAWKGGGKQETRAQRSIDIELWQPILTTPDLRFVSLQNGDPDDDIARAAQAFGVEIVRDASVDQMASLDDFAAQIAALDLVVSVDCTTVHLSGALGIPTKVLLPRVPDWRWGLSGKRTPWYDSLELYRQKSAGRWQNAIDRLALSLADFR